MSFLLVLAAVVLLAAALAWDRRKHAGTRFPPGPPRDPFIGHLRRIPKKSPWLTYTEWGRKYGPIVSVETMGKRFVFLNTAEACCDLLEKRGANYSDRPRNVMIQEMMDIKSVAFMSYDATFRAYRKVLNTALNPSAARAFTAVQEREAYAFLERLIDAPRDWSRHLRRMSSSTILTVTYGHRVREDDDPLVRLSIALVARLRRAFPPDAFLVNIVPPLRRLPRWLGLPFQTFARECQQLTEDLRDSSFGEVKRNMAAGPVPVSYVASLLDARGSITGRDDEEDIIKGTAGSMYNAGAETSLITTTYFILAMLLHPHVQKKCQAELDALLATSTGSDSGYDSDGSTPSPPPSGSTRLVSMADQPSLPYLRAVLLETLRWRMVAPLGVPHAAAADDTYAGYAIPRGAFVIANVWSVLHDPRFHPSPDAFLPERYLAPDEPARAFPLSRPKDPRQFVFGFNRRLCPGRHLAWNSLFILAANILSAFDVRRPLDPATGEEYTPEVDNSDGFPSPFDVRFVPRRGAETVRTVREMVAATS